MRVPEVAVIDFETEAIAPRPKYPPKPVSVSILLPGGKPMFYAWGHPEGNNCNKADAQRILKRVWREYDLLFQHGKFDQDVGEVHMGLPLKPWDQVHDTMFLLFLHNPHAQNLQLKWSAEEYLSIVPKERDALRQWILTHIPGARKGDWGAYISRAPAHLVGRYSAQGDAYMTWRLFKHLYPQIAKVGMLPAYNRERQLQPILLENERLGMRVDLPKLERHLPIYEKALVDAERWIMKYCRHKGEPINFDAAHDVAEMLLHTPRGMVDKKHWPKTPKSRKYSTKKEVLDDIVLDQRLRQALAYRGKLDTYLSMFLRHWTDTARETGGLIHTSWNQVRQPKGSGDSRQGTRTGRPSTSPNFLNIPKSMEEWVHPRYMRLPELPRVRDYCLPDRGGRWLHRDYNQQELRILAHFEDGKLAAAYAQNPRMDVHDWVRDEIKRITTLLLQRRSVKVINFGIIYGMGLGKLARSLKTDVKAAKEMLDGHKEALPGVKELNKEIKARAKAEEPIRTWGGRLYYCEPPAMREDEETGGAKIMTFEYKLLNYLIQGSAADCTKQAIIDYHRAAKSSRLLVTVYDEINITAPEKAHKREMKILKEAMEAQKFAVPMLSDGKVGPSWGAAKKKYPGYKEIE